MKNIEGAFEESIHKLKESSGISIQDISDWISLLNNDITEINSKIKNKTPDEINSLFNNQDEIIKFSTKWEFQEILLLLSQQFRIKAIDGNIDDSELSYIIDNSKKEIEKLQKLMFESLNMLVDKTKQDLKILKWDID